MTEEWRPVVGWDGVYEVSSHGSVRSLQRITATGRRKPGVVLQPWTNERGYRLVRLRDGDRRETWRVHRLVAFAFIGNPGPGDVVCHRNGDPSDNRLENLRWGTQSSNSLDRRDHGTDHEVNKVRCPKCHPLVEPNLRPSKTGHRKCRACKYASNWFDNHPDEDRSRFQEVSDNYLKRFMDSERLAA